MLKLTSTRLFKVAITATLLVALIWSGPYKIFNPLRGGLTFLFYPFQKVSYSLSMGFESIIEFATSIGQLKKENENLLRENQDLIGENANLHDIKKENDFLRQQLGLLPRDHYELVASNIVAQDPNGMGNWIEIDKGSDDGIKTGMPVIISKGILVGKIEEVNGKSAKVVLLTNPKSTINVMDNQTGAKGIIKGEYGLGVIFDMILQNDSVQIGNEVSTSGIGGGIPRGLYIGAVQEVHPSDDHLFQQAVVTTPVQISKLSTVFVITGNK